MKTNLTNTTEEEFALTQVNEEQSTIINKVNSSLATPSPPDSRLIRFNAFITVMKIMGNPPEFNIMVRAMSIICDPTTNTNNSNEIMEKIHSSFGAAIVANLECYDELDKEEDLNSTVLNQWTVVTFEGVKPISMGFLQRNIFVNELNDLIYVIHQRDNNDSKKKENFSQRRRRQQFDRWLNDDDHSGGWDLELGSKNVVISSVWRYNKDSRATFNWDKQVVMTPGGRQSSNHNWSVYRTRSLANPADRDKARPEQSVCINYFCI